VDRGEARPCLEFSNGEAAKAMVLAILDPDFWHFLQYFKYVIIFIFQLFPCK
jgi:hypothetical protein